MTQITNVSGNCTRLICYYETGNNLAKYLTAYKCPAGVWTIGIGTTIYPNGKRVAEGDIITTADAYYFLQADLNKIIPIVDSYTPDTLTQSQFDTLVSFAYNLGTGALKSSTLLKKVNANPNDPTIQQEFEKWKNVDGKPLAGLLKRRQSEAWLYFNGVLKFDF